MPHNQIHLCSVLDSNFLLKGLTLYESIKANHPNFRLHLLCLDENAYINALRFQNANLVVYTVSSFLAKEPKLQKHRQTNYNYFCWCLASYFSEILLKDGKPSITYVDSDVFFHRDIAVIFDEIKDSDIGVFRHRMFNLNENHPEGLFNVGVVYFRNTNLGANSLKWWSDSVLNQRYPHLATCGDQKYLDAFYSNCRHGLFIDGEIGHGAPWHWQLYDLSNYEIDGTIGWNGKKQNLVFTHFSQFYIDRLNLKYIPSTAHYNYTPLSLYAENRALKGIYDSYLERLLATASYYNI